MPSLTLEEGITIGRYPTLWQVKRPRGQADVPDDKKNYFIVDFSFFLFFEFFFALTRFIRTIRTITIIVIHF